jgi:bifunctional non-homologous end joining protein LigD
MPRHVEPMLAARAPSLPRNQRNWAFEYKWDGVRALVYWDGRQLAIDSRNVTDITPRYPELAELATQLGARPAVLDGEIVALDESGHISFSALQHRMHVVEPAKIAQLTRRVPVVYMVFDVLYLGGRDVMNLPYVERRELLEGLNLSGPRWNTPPSVAADGSAMWQAAAELRLEGVMAKRLDSPYEPGRRSGAWLKIKLINRQEFVIGGFTLGQRSLAGRLGSLMVGYYQGGLLRYAGNVGTGFTDASRDALEAAIRSLRQPASPFAQPLPLPRSVQRVYCRPELVCEVEYREWTPDGILRHPSYKGLRDDKSPLSVIREDTGS